MFFQQAESSLPAQRDEGRTKCSVSRHVAHLVARMFKAFTNLKKKMNKNAIFNGPSRAICRMCNVINYEEQKGQEMIEIGMSFLKKSGLSTICLEFFAGGPMGL